MKVLINRNDKLSLFCAFSVPNICFFNYLTNNRPQCAALWLAKLALTSSLPKTKSRGQRNNERGVTIITSHIASGNFMNEIYAENVQQDKNYPRSNH